MGGNSGGSERLQPLRIATRDSDLALWQAHHVKNLLQSRFGIRATFCTIKTLGDVDTSTPLAELEGKGFFTKELEDALIDGRADIAVHSLKDLPTQLPPGLKVAAIFSRADRCETLLIRPGAAADRKPFPLKERSVVGTSSARRHSQLQLLDPDLEIRDIRGNVPTRVKKLRDGEYDAILLAQAGLSRLNLDLGDLHVAHLPLHTFLPAPGQGALAIEIRSDDTATEDLVAPLNDPDVCRMVNAERGLLHLFSGGCKLPLGVVCEEVSGIQLDAVYSAKGRDGRWQGFRTRVTADTPGLASSKAFDDLISQKTIWAQKHKLLLGQTIVVTRSAEHVNGLRRAVEQMGGRLMPVPTLAFEPCGDAAAIAKAKADLRAYDWVLFTSANAVHFFFEPPLSDSLWPPQIRVGAVGSATERALASRRIKVVLAGHKGAADFALQFLEVAGAGARVLWPTTEHPRQELPMSLKASGVTLEPLIVYRSLMPPREAQVAADRVNPDWILATSPQAGRNFIELYGPHKDARWAAIGSSTQAELQKLLKTPVTVARETTLEALAEVLV